jgi:hypothetical protein
VFHATNATVLTPKKTRGMDTFYILYPFCVLDYGGCVVGDAKMAPWQRWLMEKESERTEQSKEQRKKWIDKRRCIVRNSACARGSDDLNFIL